MKIVSVSRVIHAPIDEVWAITSSFGAIRAWMPMVRRVRLRGAGIGSVRYVEMGGGIGEDHLIEVDPDTYRVRYALVSTVMTQAERPVGGTDLEALDANRTRITWMAEADRISGDLDVMRQRLGVFINSGIDGLAKLLGTTADPAA